MFAIASRHNIPTPATLFPQKLEDVVEFVDKFHFPVMLKGIHGNRLFARTGYKMALAENKAALLKIYQELEDPASPNLMLQEHIPGNDDQVYIFNGYFNNDSDCLSAFTGHKIRQAPVHFGCASLGICKWNSEVAEITTRFMKDIGYRGVLDIGYRLDPRDGKYKVLDIKPRVGGAFRIFVAKNGMDVVRSLYLDLTGQEQLPIVPREGRRWVYEDYDIISSYCYFKEGTLKFKEWALSFKDVEEGAWFSWKDPLPFVMMAGRLGKRLLYGIGKRISLVPK
jgi:predicted ATP-grasp superfamily ATP-dependent carboligase